MMKMNKEQVDGRWSQLIGKVQTKWSKLAHDDVAVIAGRREQLHELYGISEEEAEKEIAKMEKSSPWGRDSTKYSMRYQHEYYSSDCPDRGLVRRWRRLLV
jgi:uncharacterized protein YjbJ (UPF0337 family)